MLVQSTELAGVVVVEPRAFHDERGYFMETFNAARYADIGVGAPFVQDNISYSAPGVLRGLHFQFPYGQGKLVSVLDGEVFDVAVDIRVGSPTFGRWHGEHLSSVNRRQLYIPPGFAHGFVVTGGAALVAYKCTETYHPQSERTVLWNDPGIGVAWPVAQPTLSEKDRQQGSLLSDIPAASLPVYVPGE